MILPERAEYSLTESALDRLYVGTLRRRSKRTAQHTEGVQLVR